MSDRKKLQDLDTYVFIDASNIRSACLKSCNFNIDFFRLYEYLKRKYKNLKTVNYYEGIARGDFEKRAIFDNLGLAGYNIRTLQRRTYTDPAMMKTFTCRHCGKHNRVEAVPRETKMKSNVDVYLASEMLKIAYTSKGPVHLIIFSCDGDYAETIKIATENQNITVSVVATPPQDRTRNSLSIRLQELRREINSQYHLNNIEAIKDSIKIL